MMHAKITKIESNHQNLRTNDMEGKTPVIPEVGERFIIFGESLTPGNNARVIQTTEVQESTYDSATKTFTFKTKNSLYTVEITDKHLTDEEIFSHGKWKKT